MYRANSRLNRISELYDQSNKTEKNESEQNINSLNDKIKKIKEEKKTSLLKQFLDNTTKYDDEEYTLLSDIRKKFKEYCYSLDKNNLDNMNYNLSKEDIIKYNDKYRIKYYSFCRSCNTRYRYKCCDENNRLNRASKEVILFMKIRA